MAGEDRVLANGAKFIDFQTDPSRYRHWKLEVAGEVATLSMDVDEDGGLFEGYQLKLNSYDLGVDIELADAVQRLRFEHPDVKVVVLRSGKNRVFCAGANIRMLAGASHAHKVNFCKFTNETRNGIEDLSANSGLQTICAITGTAAGGGYDARFRVRGNIAREGSVVQHNGDGGGRIAAFPGYVADGDDAASRHFVCLTFAPDSCNVSCPACDRSENAC